uniref:Uncharacterized protein n=1 Tax=Oryza punctata TaxID=4537 RepID=A0A0E0LC06_ORYPU
MITRHKQLLTENRRRGKKNTVYRASGVACCCSVLSSSQPQLQISASPTATTSSHSRDEMRLSASAEAEGLQERIWDLHDKLSHAILSLSASARRAATPRLVVVKGSRRQQQGGCGDCGLEQEEAAAMADARSLHAVRAALEDLEGHLHFLHNIQLRQVAERDAAIARLQQSSILLATRLAEHRWKKHEVIEEALAFVNDALDKSRFISPEDVRGTHTHSQSVENQCPKIHDSNFLMSVKNTREKHLDVLLARG